MIRRACVVRGVDRARGRRSAPLSRPDIDADVVPALTGSSFPQYGRRLMLRSRAFLLLATAGAGLGVVGCTARADLQPSTSGSGGQSGENGGGNAGTSGGGDPDGGLPAG